MHTAQRHLISEAEYLAMEAEARERHEYVAGEAYAMAGGSQRHNRIALNLAAILLGKLSGRPCQVFMSDVKLHVAAADAYYYPDVMVTCADQPVAAGEAHVVESALLVVEVLSAATEAIDRREKLAAYRKLAGLQEYALVSQDRRQVEIYRRQGDIGWLYVTYEVDDTVRLESVGIELAMNELYMGTDVLN